MVTVDFRSDTTEFLLNPRLAPDDSRTLRRMTARVPPLPSHVWLTTSGTSGAPKLVALAKSALLASAEAVNAHLDSRADDIWFHALPLVHVAGLGILARASLSGARVIGEHGSDGLPKRWDPKRFRRKLDRSRATLTALVPTQVHDLCHARLTAPPALRAAIVGGDALLPETYREARRLGWPLLPSYGATETASQVATASLDSLAETHEALPPLRPLSHAEFRHDEDERLWIRATSTLTGYGVCADLADPESVTLIDPREDGWWRSSDRGRVEDGAVVVFGRIDEVVKRSGELVSIPRLEARLATMAAALNLDAALIARPDPRDGHALWLIIAGAPDEATAARLRERYDASVAPWERASNVVTMPSVPRTALGKVRRAALAAAVEDQIRTRSADPS